MKPTSIKSAWKGSLKCQLCPIKDKVLFADLTEDDFQQLHLPINEIELAAGSVLYQPTDDNNYIYTLRSGSIKLVHYLTNGNYRITRILRQGDLAGIEALNGSAYFQHAISMQNTSICQIPVKNIEHLNLKSSNLYKQLMDRWQKAQSEADIWLTDFTMGNSKQRVAKLLIYLAEQESEQAFFLPPREDIGALLAITTETASRMIAEFRRDKTLNYSGNTASINLKKLNIMIMK